MINRAAIILKYKEPAIRWVNDSDLTDVFDNTEIAEDEINSERTVYLISDEDAETDESVSQWVELNYLNMFQNELDSWITDESMWPQNLTLMLFHEWFDVECHTMIVDTVSDDPILDDEDHLPFEILH